MIAALARRGLLAATTLGGWSFVALQERLFEFRFEAAGLRAERFVLPSANLHVWHGGARRGRPLLLLHGFGADALWGWVPQSALAKDRTLIVPDLAWFGRSEGTRGAWDTRDQARAMIELLDALDVEEVDVAGISYGGFVALELAAGWGKRVRRLVLIDSPGHNYTLADYHDMLERLGLESVSDLVVPNTARDVKRLVKLAWFRAPPVPSFVARDVFAKMFQSHRDEKVRLLDALLARAARIDPSAYHIPQPTLILWGDRDPLFPLPLAHRLAAAIGPHAHVEVVANASHAPNLEHPSRFVGLIHNFLTPPASKRRARAA